MCILCLGCWVFSVNSVVAQCNFSATLSYNYDCVSSDYSVLLRICSSTAGNPPSAADFYLHNDVTQYWGTEGGPLGACDNSVTWSDIPPGSYTLKINSTLCSNHSIVLPVPQPPSITIRASRSPYICVGDEITLTASGGSNYSWNGSDGGYWTGSAITVSPSSNTTYTVQGQVSGCTGSYDSESFEVHVTPAVSAVTLTGPNGRCQSNGPGETTNYSATASDYTHFTWGLSSEEPTSPGTISASGVVTWNQAFAGLATVTVTAYGCGGSSSTKSRAVEVRPYPTDILLNLPQSVCEGQSTTGTLDGVEQDVAYYLFKDGSESDSWEAWTHSGTSIPVSGLTIGTYQVFGRRNACNTLYAVADERIIAVTPRGQLSVSASADEICDGDPVTLTAHGGRLYSSWSSDPPTDFTEMSGNSILVHSLSIGTDFSVTGYEAICNTEITSPVKHVLVNPRPIAEGDEEDEVCSGNATSISVTSDILNTTYAWTVEYDNASGTSSSGQGSSIVQTLTVPANSVGAALYSVVPTSPEGCDGSVWHVNVTVHGNPTIPIMGSEQYCDFESIALKGVLNDDIADYRWYDGSSAVPHQAPEYWIGAHQIGNYSYQFETVGHHGCISEQMGTLHFSVVSDCDTRLNYIERMSYTRSAQGAESFLVAHSRQYFDLTGRPLQSQTKQLATNQVWLSQPLRDEYDRDVLSTMSAPGMMSDFRYKHWFVTDSDGGLYTFDKFNEPVGNSEPGTLGWYYSINNTLETHQPLSQFPYSRTDFYEDGTGEARMTAGPGEVHRLGQGHEVVRGTFPVFKELDDYLLKRAASLGITSPISTLANEGVQSVVRDENGRYVVSVSDKAGNTMMQMRAGTADSSVLEIANTVVASGDPESVHYRPMTYFYILHDQPVTISGSTDFVVEDIVAAAPFTGTGGEWPAGFYRILLSNESSEVTISYTNYYLDVSCQFYDNAGRLRVSVSPNGYRQWTVGEEPYADIDKTTYKYNHQGWLLSMTEPDAGTTHYVYRKDGKIRFSENEEQRAHGRFSYTHYDEIGRPVESGEYRGNNLSFAAMTSTGFASSAMAGLLEKSYEQIKDEDTALPTAEQVWVVGDLADWVRTHYDEPATGIPNLDGTEFEQEFVRGAVSWTENSNIRTWYSYDEMGRLAWMAQKPAALGRTFVTRYSYDFLGNVTEVLNSSYVGGARTLPFYHHYQYDADYRLAKVFTSSDGTNRTLRATYDYYLHGPLKRIELGNKTQGIDFIYNINGWLTQINHPNKGDDPGGDGNDVFGMVLDYYESALTNLFQTASKPQTVNPFEFHNIIQPSQTPERRALAEGSRIALRIGAADWRQSILEALRK